MSLFTKAKEANSAKQSSSVKKPKKSTTWIVGDGESQSKVSKAVGELRKLNAEKKAVDAKMEVFKTVCKTYAREQFFSTYADNGVYPETPMKVQNSEGESVTYVVQDRSTQYPAKPEQVEMLQRILGEDGASEMVGTETTFAFQRSAMMNPELMPILERHLEAAIAEASESGLIEGFEDVLEVTERTAFKPGTLQRLAMICGSDSVKMRQVMDAMSSAAPNYILV